MAKLTLYHASPSRSSIVLWMLEELGEPYDIHLLSLTKGENREPAYLAINPMGKVPAIRHGDTVITEAAAICTYLADEFPAARLNVPVGAPRRGVYLKWLFFGPSCIEPAVIDRAAPRKEEARRGMLGYGDFDTTMNTVAAAVAQGAVADGRAVHRGRRDHRREYPLGHDVQDDPRAAGIHRLCGRGSRRARRRNAPRRRTRSSARRRLVREGPAAQAQRTPSSRCHGVPPRYFVKSHEVGDDDGEQRERRRPSRENPPSVRLPVIRPIR